MRLSELATNVHSVVREVESLGADDAIARRLRDLGFVAGEPLVIVASAPMGRDPLLVQIGYTRFALRRSEAARVRIEEPGGEASHV
ncbi:MAG: FeoA domain-containing protein [Dokdonella sp.]